MTTPRNAFTPAQEAWLAALESGQWQQCVGRLHAADDSAHCCLGVAMRVVQGLEQSATGAEYLSSDTASEQLNLRDGSGGIDGDNWRYCAALAIANDSGITFAEIAAFIRAEPWRVFSNFDKPEAVK